MVILGKVQAALKSSCHEIYQCSGLLLELQTNAVYFTSVTCHYGYLNLRLLFLLHKYTEDFCNRKCIGLIDAKSQKLPLYNVPFCNSLS